MTAEKLLAWLPTNYELSFHYDPFEREEDLLWQVHRVNGSINDREWTLVGEGETPLEALRVAYNNC